MDFVGLGIIGKVPDPDLFSTPSYNKCLALLTAGIVSTAISSKTNFVEWHTTKGGWVSYANDFLASWPGCDLIVDSSSSVPIKKGVVKEIDATTPVGKGNEKKIKKETVKKSKVEESAEDTKAGQDTKRRKTTSSRKQLIISKDLGEVGSSAVGKEVGHPPIPNIRKKTKVGFSILQISVDSFKRTSSIVVTSLAQDFLGSFTIIS